MSVQIKENPGYSRTEADPKRVEITQVEIFKYNIPETCSAMHG